MSYRSWECISVAEHVPVMALIPRTINKKTKPFFLRYWELNPRPHS